MDSDVGTEKYLPSETVLANNIVIPHVQPEYEPTAVRKLGINVSNTGKVTTLETIDKTAPPFNTFELPVEQFSFVEFYHNLKKHDLKSKLRCERISQSNTNINASSSDIANFVSLLPMTQKDDEFDFEGSEWYFLNYHALEEILFLNRI